MLTATPFYRDNLAALASFQPRVAEIVDAARIPPGVTPARGRDGSSTLLVPAEEGGSIWFGGSSMPSVSAVEMFAGFVSDGRNVSLPGVLTGVEPLVVINKLPLHTALFVVEEHAWHVRLAPPAGSFSSWETMLRGRRASFLRPIRATSRQRDCSIRPSALPPRSRSCSDGWRMRGRRR